MGEIASKGQLRMSLLRWAVVTIPAALLLGFVSAQLSGSTGESAWYQALVKPPLQPPPWLFPVAWTILYALIGLSLAIVLNARGARNRPAALLLFAVHMLLNYLWSPVFFGAHKVHLALGVIAAMLVTGIALTLMFGRIRSAAAWALLPYLVWMSFAAALNFGIMRLNPDAETLVPGEAATQIAL